MKKVYLILFFLILCTHNLFSFSFKANDDVIVYVRDENGVMNLQNKKYLKKGTVIDFSNANALIDFVYLKKANATLAFINGGSEFGGYITLSNLILNNDVSLPKGIITVNDIGIKIYSVIHAGCLKI